MFVEFYFFGILVGVLIGVVSVGVVGFGVGILSMLVGVFVGGLMVFVFVVFLV